MIITTKAILVMVHQLVRLNVLIVCCLMANLVLASESIIGLEHDWEVNPSEFEFSMTLIGEMDANTFTIDQKFHELGVFVDTDLRGVAQLTHIESQGRDLFFLTIYANQVGELLSFQVYDSLHSEYIDLAEQILFTPDIHMGSISDPIQFSPLNPTNTTDLQGIQVKIFPNPFDQILHIVLKSNWEDKEVRIFHSNGQILFTNKSITNKALETINTSSWIPGLYIIQIFDKDNIVNHSILKLP